MSIVGGKIGNSRLIFDLLIVNLSAVFAFVFRGYYGDIAKQPPLSFWMKYVLALLSFNFLYLFVSWLVGLYDRRKKRALLEEYLLIFGVIMICLSVLVVFLFLGRLWWVSRTVLYLFIGISIGLLCVSRTIIKSKQPLPRQVKTDLAEIISRMTEAKQRISFAGSVRLSVIIVTYNSIDNVRNCLDSLKKAALNLPYDVIVIDNNSTDGTVEMLKKEHPGVEVVANPDNIGYSRAINQGLRWAKSEYCLILNPDIIVLPGAIEIMLDHLARHQGVGLLGCKLLNEDGTLQYSVRRFLDLRTYLYRFTPLRSLMAGSAIERYYLMQEWGHNDNRPVDWVLGGCMLGRKQALLDVGLMDERFFIYFEDVDLCYRLWVKGWQVAYVAEAAMTHQHARTSANKLFNRATYEHFRSLFYFLWKHGLKLPANSPSVQE